MSGWRIFFLNPSLSRLVALCGAEILLPLWEKEGGAKRRKDEGE
jgi:hypothetical protein